MINDEYFFCRSQLWQQRGDAKMRSLLATLGLTLTECKQMYSALSQERKKEVFDILQKEINSSFASFTAIARGCNRYLRVNLFCADVYLCRIEIAADLTDLP
ncbi:unnamed protein product [Toxocara canis]|uniref:Uncharacterized protein n=1 Tax=Toxocara canis TaxID=6265 RepID=A0A183U5L0_TOXCA|nr:unnamed protein product [Toxocara canis]